VIGLDTNVVVRYLTQDDPAQAALANRLIEESLSPDHPGFVSSVVLVELVWVLESGYRCDRAQISEVLNKLLRSRQIVVQSAEVAWQAARAFSAGKADFADYLIERTGNAHGCERTVTFDRSAARNGPMQLVAAVRT
jgi:predicted nucleic-acid-binding protein